VALSTCLKKKGLEKRCASFQGRFRGNTTSTKTGWGEGGKGSGPSILAVRATSLNTHSAIHGLIYGEKFRLQFQLSHPGGDLDKISGRAHGTAGDHCSWKGHRLEKREVGQRVAAKGHCEVPPSFPGRLPVFVAERCRGGERVAGTNGRWLEALEKFARIWGGRDAVAARSISRS